MSWPIRAQIVTLSNACHTMCVMRTARLNLRVDEHADRLIRDAADSAGVTVSVFVERAAVNEAHQQLADQIAFVLSPDSWDAFVAGLESPARELPALQRAVVGYRQRHGDGDAG
jgi:uncharacterized protein (DUF1778 family)